MKNSVTQEFDYGCAIACMAFVLENSYSRTIELLNPNQQFSERFYIKDLTSELSRLGKSYSSRYVKPHLRKKIYQEAAIVLIARSKTYPVGHYLVRHNKMWMDPWINMKKSNYQISEAESGYRKRLPGRPMYVLIPD